MSRIKKPKNQVIVVPSVTKMAKKGTKTQKTFTKSHPVRSKADTLAYYDCLIDQVANPLNDKKKITQISSYCRCKKGEVATAHQEHKQQLVKQLAKDYLAFGESLGHYLHADIVSCAKELKSK